MDDTSFDRPVSPFLELKPDAPKGSTEHHYFQMIINREKIHRIRPRLNFLGYISYVTSPSEIWVRPFNHIADKLTLPFNTPLELEKDLKEDIYVMTPLNEEILVRARILQFCNVKEKYLLRLIDYGKPVWRDAKNIYEMKSKKDEMRKYPWQAIPITLQGIDPRNGKKWSDTEIYTICEAFSEFSTYFIMPTLHDTIAINDDSTYTRASINGLTENDLESLKMCKSKDLLDKFGYSIAEYYNMLLHLYSPIKELKMDFVRQKCFAYPNQYDDINDIEYQAFDTPSKDDVVVVESNGFESSDIKSSSTEIEV